ncbi:OPT oligopeptide transporter protein-domain-containing protein [Rhexocercosporidium sp. MPI-PUGE-AT-0058]|nr:OPT oligopeptide transporter protein-domain-containing protein [Rhexocercosporidium sp. MPI-PUGE-AT-0058]
MSSSGDTEGAENYSITMATNETVQNAPPVYDGSDDEKKVQAELSVPREDLLQVQEGAKNLDLEETRNACYQPLGVFPSLTYTSQIMIKVMKIYERDPKFPIHVIERIREFPGDSNIFENPEKHADIIQEMKTEAALITANSPYSEVRAVVDNTDDPSTPSSTIRAHGLKPGKFSKKEHMLITIMANIGWHTPYTDYIIWTQVLPQFFNQPYARGFAYQFLMCLGTNFIGDGIAGLCKRFLVYPSFCVWPASLVAIALNAAFHSEMNEPSPAGEPVLTCSAVQSTLKKIITVSRLKFVAWSFAAIFDPFMVPFFNTANKFAGMFMSMFVVLGLCYTNSYNTSYLPINTNRVWDRFWARCNVSSTIDSRGIFDPVKYEAYSPASLGAANLVVYLVYFGIYSAAISYSFLYHGHEIRMGFKNLYKSIASQKIRRISQVERPTLPSESYGIALCLVFVIPIGLITAMTGIEVTPNVLAEFIGGTWVARNALAMKYFQGYGYVTCAHAIPPRHTFFGQMIATFVSTFVCIGVLNFQINEFPEVCTPNQSNKFTCPGIKTFFTAAVLWGTLGPHKIFGKNGQCTAMLVGFPIGLILPFVIFYAQNKLPKQT